MATIKSRLRKDGIPTFSVQVRLKNFPHIKKTFLSLSEAKEWAALTEKALRASLENPEEKLAQDMFDRYMFEEFPKRSRDQKTDEIKHIEFWKQELKGQFINSISSERIERTADLLYKKKSQKTGMALSSETRRKYLMTLSYIYNIALTQWKWAKYNPVYGVDKHTKKTKKEKTLPIPLIVNKASYISEIQSYMSEHNIISLKDLARVVGMPRETIRGIMHPDMNCTLLSMALLAKAIGKDFKFTWN